MAAYTKFQIFTSDLCSKVHDLVGTAGAGADTLKIYLSNTAPNVATNTVKADLAEITTGNGYAGAVSTQNVGVAATGTVTVTGTNITITASGGAIAAFQYIVLFNDTPTSPADPLVAYWNYGSALTLNDGDSLVVKFNAGVSSGTICTLT